jgi:hypothetical protein
MYPWDYIFYCLSIYFKRILILLLLHIDICTRFKKAGRKAMYLYCVYPAISQIPKQQPDCLQIAFFFMVFYENFALLPFLTVALRELGGAGSSNPFRAHEFTRSFIFVWVFYFSCAMLYQRKQNVEHKLLSFPEHLQFVRGSCSSNISFLCSVL